jgi:gliding motility-associated protein GldL
MGFKKRYQNIVEKFLSGDQGKRFFQIFYSLGAAIIIIGVLAKLMHWPHGLGNTLLYVGFITEAIVFALSAFDRPVKDWSWDRVFPVLDTNEEEDRPVFGNGNAAIIHSAPKSLENMTPGQVTQSFGIPSAVNISEEETGVLSDSIKKMASAAGRLSQMSDVLLESYQHMADNTKGLSASSRDYAEQMDTLNRNIQGLSSFYELQLKTVSSQIESIERINAGLTRIKEMYEGSVLDSSLFRSETEKMTQQIHALNGVYNRLLNAMTMNMYGTGGAAPFHPNPAGFNPNPYNQQTNI